MVPVIAVLPDGTNLLFTKHINGIIKTMQSITMVWSLSLLLALAPSLQQDAPRKSGDKAEISQRAGGVRQLAAVRGEITRMANAAKGTLLITVRPAKEFQEVTVLARENDLVGTAVGRSGEPDLLGLLSDDARDDETITAAELSEGDIVSVIYDPQLQNRALEIYLH